MYMSAVHNCHISVYGNLKLNEAKQNEIVVRKSVKIHCKNVMRNNVKYRCITRVSRYFTLFRVKKARFFLSVLCKIHRYSQ